MYCAYTRVRPIDSTTVTNWLLITYTLLPKPHRTQEAVL